MIEIDLEREIEESTLRIRNRESEIQSELITLERKIKVYTRWAWGFVWTGIAISIFSIFYYLCKYQKDDFGLNLLGDFLGGSVASIWALAGLFLIYVAFLGQKLQLLNQQLEIMYSQLEVKYTRLEMAGQKKEMILQNKTLLNQKFENTFFQLLSLFNNIIDSLDLRKKNDNSVIATGRDCFQKFYQYQQQLTRRIIGDDRVMADASLEEVLKAYFLMYTKNKADLSHYFRTIYHIFKFIDDSDIKDKKRYASIARAQLSSYEQLLLFYNCLHDNGRIKFKPLVEKYALLKNIDENLILSLDHCKEYKKSAFDK